MKKKIVSILMATMAIASVSMFTGCNEKPETSVGASGKNLTDEISKIKEEETTSVTEETTEAKENKSGIDDMLNKNDPMNYLTYLDKTLADAMEDFDDLNFDAGYPKTLTMDPGCCVYACPAEGVWFRYNGLTNGEEINYKEKIIEEIWIDDPDIMEDMLNKSVLSLDRNDIYYASVDGVSYELLYAKSFISVMISSNDSKTEPVEEPTPTEPPVTSSNMWNIYVTGNTDLAVMAGNTLIDKAEDIDSRTYGDVFTNGFMDSDGYLITYSDVSVAVNESPTKPMNGTIIVSATRTDSSTGMNYPLTVTVEWQATDFGDYMNFTWLSKDING